MNFDLGYLVVLGAVVVILLIYRQLDKNNRSLEKIRKYAETVRQDLNSFVEERTSTIRDFETVLKVHDKTATEILRRIQLVEDNLLSRTPEIESMQLRLDTYRDSMKDLESLSSKVDSNLGRLKEESEFVDKVGRRIKLAGDQMTALETGFVQVRQEFADVNQKDLEAVKMKTLEIFDKETLQYVQRLADASRKVDELQTFVQSLDDRKDRFLTELEAELTEAAQERFARTAEQAESLSVEVLKKMDDKITSLAEQSESRLRDELKDISLSIGDDIATLGQEATAAKNEAEQFSATIEQNLEGLKKQLADAEKEIQSEFQGEQAQLMALTAQLKNDLEQKVVTVRKEAFSQADDLRSELVKTLELDRQNAQTILVEVRSSLGAVRKETEDREQKLMNALELRIKDYEAGFGYRLQKMEEVEKDIGMLDTNLRQAMEKVAQRVQEDFTGFDSKMEQRRQEEKAALEARMLETRNALSVVEKELEDLKGRAYDNVSEKLQGFEEEFFQDLQKRNAQMQQSFEDWNEGVRTRLEDLKSASEKDRVETERGYTDLLRVRIQELQGASFQQFDKVEKQILDYQEKLSGQVEAYHEAIEETRNRLKGDLNDLEKNLQTRFEQEFARHEITAQEAFTKLDREVEGKVKLISDNFDMSRSEFQTALDSSQSELGLFQNKLSQRIKELENDLGDQYRSFKQSLGEKVSALTDDFTSQKEELVSRTAEERAGLRNDLTQIRNGIDELENSLRLKSETALETFRREYEAFNLEQQKKNRDLGADMENRLKDYRNAVQDTREKSEALQKKVFGRIEDQSSLLAVTLDEIDKKQKGFIAQTKVFDRADSLKQELQESIEDLKGDLAKLEVQRKELFEVEAQISRVKKLGDEATEKLNRFIAEKKRIDVMDTDFQKIIGLSQAMELRLEQVTSSNDLLQDIQYKIRKLEDFSKEVEVKYERLEKRREVLDTTTDGVDRNFSLLEKMEKTAKSLSGEMAQLPGEVEELRKRMKVLAQGKEDADKAVERLGQLDQVLREVEGRISKMEEAREWIARTETRLNEANEAAEEQLRTMATISRGTATTAGTKAKGAINTDIRQTVIKLARQGWGKEEIARATKLSMGEVELILELGPR